MYNHNTLNEGNSNLLGTKDLHSHSTHCWRRSVSNTHNRTSRVRQTNWWAIGWRGPPCRWRRLSAGLARAFWSFSLLFSPLRWVVLSLLIPTVSFPTCGADVQALGELQATGEQSTRGRTNWFYCSKYLYLFYLAVDCSPRSRSLL